MQNKKMFEKRTLKVYERFTKNVIGLITDALGDSTHIMKLLGISDIPYFYQTTDHLYYVPSADLFTKDELVLVEIKSEKPKGSSGIVLKTKVAKKSLKNSGKYAEFEIRIRYTNKPFGKNSTVKIQEVKNMQNISWELLS
jgi:hypothetical protein